jgi:hypothetical protein
MSGLSQVSYSNVSHAVPATCLPDGTGGRTLRTKIPLSGNTTICTLPLSAAITPETARMALASVCHSVDSLLGLNERQLICAYMTMHWVIPRCERSEQVVLDQARGTHELLACSILLYFGMGLT